MTGGLRCALAALPAVLALVACAAAPAAPGAHAGERELRLEMGATLAAAIRGLDSEQFLEDEPIWLCATGADAPSGPLPGWLFHGYRLVGHTRDGARVSREYDLAVPAAPPSPRGGELAQTFAFVDPSGREPLLGDRGGIPEGAWEVRGQGADSSRVLVRFRVVEPRGSERSVRDGLARAARLARAGGREAEAAALYEAILRRYPRTTYLSVLYAGLWRVRGHTRFADDPDRWLEEIFARFHDTCFGTLALDQWVRDMGPERAHRTVAHLVGLYPDTPLARAARRYL